MVLIEKEGIFLDIDQEDKYTLINFLANGMLNANKISNLEEYVESVLERERLVSTSVGNAVAIPHGKSKAVLKPTVYFARTNKLVRWGEGEEDLVDLIFMLAVPDDDKSNDHLRILAQLSRKLVDENFRNTLRAIENVEVAQSLFDEIL